MSSKGLIDRYTSLMLQKTGADEGEWWYTAECGDETFTVFGDFRNGIFVSSIFTTNGFIVNEEDLTVKKEEFY